VKILKSLHGIRAKVLKKTEVEHKGFLVACNLKRVEVALFLTGKEIKKGKEAAVSVVCVNSQFSELFYQLSEIWPPACGLKIGWMVSPTSVRGRNALYCYWRKQNCGI